MTANNDVWALVYEKLSEKFSDTVRTLWFSSLEPVAMSDSCCVLLSDSDMKADILNKKYSSALEQVFEETVGFPVSVVVLSAQHGKPDVERISARVAAGEKIEPFSLSHAVPEQMPAEESPSLEPVFSDKAEEAHENRTFVSREYTFENYIVGNSNQFAHAACVAVANNPAATTYNPLFIYGQSGLGKTHLLYAITNRIHERSPSANIVYIKGEAFTIELIQSISDQTTVEFRNKYRKADVLLIDDIQFIAGKPSTQEEFFHTFNALYEDQKQIILASDRPPRDIKTLEDRLRTRFEWGVICDIQPPDLELRIAILRSKAQALDVEIPSDVQLYLAEKLKNNIRQIEGALRRLSAYKNLTKQPITPDVARDCISDVLSGAEPLRVTIDRIFAAVAKKYGVSADDIRGARRSKEIAMARHISIYIIRSVSDLSLPAIGRIFNRDHTTILSSIDVVEKRMKESPSLEQEIEDLIIETQKDM